jgi:LacI family repressor for deo operon, udp, cdd, tsx, nupC, and nupG
MLRTSRTRLVIALVPDIANPFFAEVIRGIEQVAHAHRYSVLLGDTQNSPAREQAYADMITARKADGLISLVPRIPRHHGKSRFPFVNACEYVPDDTVTRVHVDNVAAAISATTHLISLGHTRIAYIGGPKPSAICLDRQKGYETALRQAGLRVHKALISEGDFSVESGISATQHLLSSRQPFTAIFCANDEMALGSLQALRSVGLKVPHDVSVVGFDDIRYARYSDPPLTTVAQPKTDLGREAMRSLLEILDNSATPACERILAARLVVRGSTARCRTKHKR